MSREVARGERTGEEGIRMGCGRHTLHVLPKARSGLAGGDDLVAGVGEADEVQLDGVTGEGELSLPPPGT
jgi:hypothetical protein